MSIIENLKVDKIVEVKVLIEALKELDSRLFKLENENPEIIEFIKFHKINLDDLKFLIELKSVCLGQSGINTVFRGIGTGVEYRLRTNDFKYMSKVFK